MLCWEANSYSKNIPAVFVYNTKCTHTHTHGQCVRFFHFAISSFKNKRRSHPQNDVTGTVLAVVGRSAWGQPPRPPFFSGVGGLWHSPLGHWNYIYNPNWLWVNSVCVHFNYSLHTLAFHSEKKRIDVSANLLFKGPADGLPNGGAPGS